MVPTGIVIAIAFGAAVFGCVVGVIFMGLAAMSGQADQQEANELLRFKIQELEEEAKCLRTERAKMVRSMSGVRGTTETTETEASDASYLLDSE